ncbi:hypothetical protein ESCO_003083 [Escovopsis weberi]|uniref:Uncharacterized protein n=1 Tax=Escovopsis weberi TaxID=150374 RepID=A0A0M8N1F8_ESCWE|nr:hypothetical protein ESCO_003083 [Escovopsis weberi]
MASTGLSSSIWASSSRAGRAPRYDMRSRSVPAEPEHQQQQQQLQRQQQQQKHHHHPSRLQRSPVDTAPNDNNIVDNIVNNNNNSAAAAASSSALRASNITPALAFHRFEQACQRLRWKYIDLGNSYKRALSPEEWGFSAQDAERSFKVDFYEFYAWIEQTLVLALLVFGVAVSRERRFGEADGDFRGTRARTRTGIGSVPGPGFGSAPFAAHSYHHNVLRALDEEDNPLHRPLGSGDVNHALWKAKELRNRWKDAAEGRETPPLKMYDLTWIVTTILGGLEVAYSMAYERVEEIKRAGNGSAGDVEVNESADAWEWMVEMDWES